jgi:hypothetical protein
MMKIMKVIKMATQVGATHLAGTDMGVAHLPKLLEAALKALKGEVLILDFNGVDATASYLSQSVIKLLRMANGGELDCFFVFAGLNKNTRDDLEIVLMLQKMAALLTNSKKIGSAQSLEVVGHLEPLYRSTLNRILSVKSATAEELMSGAKEEAIQKTGWLNRLAFLAGKKLIQKAWMTI